VDARQEREVRLTAQRILETHLDSGEPATFWPGMDLDLTGATLIDFRTARWEVPVADFSGAQFLGVTQFTFARFALAMFGAAEFHGYTRFSGARFDEYATFAFARFSNQVWFDRSRFDGDVTFEGAAFGSLADFNDAEFYAHASFVRAEFAPFQLHTEMWARADATLPQNRLWPISRLGPEPVAWREADEPVTREGRDGRWVRITYDPVELLDRPDTDPDPQPG
jgi:uncharacterized protein YjbI with pentapeptide repeats